MVCICVKGKALGVGERDTLNIYLGIIRLLASLTIQVFNLLEQPARSHRQAQSGITKRIQQPDAHEDGAASSSFWLVHWTS